MPEACDVKRYCHKRLTELVANGAKRRNQGCFRPHEKIQLKNLAPLSESRSSKTVPLMATHMFITRSVFIQLQVPPLGILYISFPLARFDSVSLLHVD